MWFKCTEGGNKKTHISAQAKGANSNTTRLFPCDVAPAGLSRHYQSPHWAKYWWLYRICWHRLQSHSNCSVIQMADRTNGKYSVDFEKVPFINANCSFAVKVTVKVLWWSCLPTEQIYMHISHRDTHTDGTNAYSFSFLWRKEGCAHLGASI